MQNQKQNIRFLGFGPKFTGFPAENVQKKASSLHGDNIVYAYWDQEQILVNVMELQLLWRHNYENVLAAAYMGLLMGIPFEKILDTVRQFNPVQHWIEFVRKRTSVRYYDDSQGTYP